MENQAAFLPLNAINEFMRSDFRLSVIRDVITRLDTLPKMYASTINSQIKHNAKIPGFRNSEKAPGLLKIMPAAKVFEKQPEMVGAILKAWAYIYEDLYKQVYSMLISRGWAHIDEHQDVTPAGLSSELISQWPLLPLNLDRTRFPGFVPRWPKGEDFEELYQTYNEQYPEGNHSTDQVSLMAVWVAMRLPYTIEEHSP